MCSSDSASAGPGPAACGRHSKAFPMPETTDRVLSLHCFVLALLRARAQHGGARARNRRHHDTHTEITLGQTSDQRRNLAHFDLNLSNANAFATNLVKSTRSELLGLPSSGKSRFEFFDDSLIANSKKSSAVLLLALLNPSSHSDSLANVIAASESLMTRERGKPSFIVALIAS
jgi:hypothetical protein